MTHHYAFPGTPPQNFELIHLDIYYSLSLYFYYIYNILMISYYYIRGTVDPYLNNLYILG